MDSGNWGVPYVRRQVSTPSLTSWQTAAIATEWPQRPGHPRRVEILTVNIGTSRNEALLAKVGPAVLRVIEVPGWQTSNDYPVRLCLVLAGRRSQLSQLLETVVVNGDQWCHWRNGTTAKNWENGWKMVVACCCLGFLGDPWSCKGVR